MNILKTISISGLKQPIPLPQYLLHHVKGFKKQKVQLQMHKKWVTVNGIPSGEDAMVKNGDELQITSPYTTHQKIFAENIPLEILEENDDWLVVNKPPKMACHGGLGNYHGTLLNALAYHYETTNQTPELFNGLVHRLDKETSGLMVVAKTKKGLDFLSPQFQNKTAKRKYIAKVHGTVSPQKGTINVPIGRHPDEELTIMANPPQNAGKEAITHYTVLQHDENHSIVECELETGRTNQIRIHLQYIGHSIVGDKRYPPVNGVDENATRMLLHAHQLTFCSFSGEIKTYKCTAPFYRKPILSS